ncbi:hypothetical protein FVEG_14560 [Fusarium verticillioides 7600]|uniref:Uncharacterized protein n=1 Tax=Gibberella moniliformis (strain M3125 / FGSC 7600) TaxID=334819 RepID=W7LJN2_GIBM7|nr:hypothetical protein FVEG_14560 [Fusarium verticillioides 7600]EWG35780.1 hypothetical protein FVEG_14560 [Fusarium verticillioides 7600]
MRWPFLDLSATALLSTASHAFSETRGSQRYAASTQCYILYMIGYVEGHWTT